MSLVIKKIKLHNFMGIQELEVEPGKFNEITTKNGVGKTSFIEALKNVCSAGAKDVTVLRDGEEAEVFLELSDGSTIKKTTDSGGVNLRVKVDNKSIEKPAGYINTLIGATKVNPIDFVLCGKEERVKVLMSSIKSDISDEQLIERFGSEFCQDISEQKDIFKKVEKIRKNIYTERTYENRVVSESSTIISNIEKTLEESKDIDFDVESKESELNEKLNKAAEVKNSEISRIHGKLKTVLSERQQIIDAKLAEIEKIKEEINVVKIEMSKIDAAAKASEGKAEAAYDAVSNGIKEERAKYSSAIQSKTLIESQKSQLKGLIDKKTVSELKSTKLTEKLDDIESLKLEILSKANISGLDVKEDDIYVDGVPFDRVNMAQKMKIAIDICSGNPGKLSIICVDGIEAFDRENFEVFKKEAMSRDNVQFFVTRVDHSENPETTLKVKSQN